VGLRGQRKGAPQRINSNIGRFMNDIDKHGFRANVGIILIDNCDQVLLGGRIGTKGWQFPQGGIHPRERIEDAMYRELKEEIGLEPRDIDLVGVIQGWLRYRLPKRYVRRNEKPVCIGQKQRWYLLRLLGKRELIRFDATNKPEFDRCRWVDYWAPVKEVIYFKRQVYMCALKELAPLAFPKNGPPLLPDWWPETID